MLLLNGITDNVFRGKFTKLTVSLLLLIGIAATLILPTKAALIGYYYDNESGNSFKMPTGWTYELTEDDFFEANFLPNNSNIAISMQYSSRDIWSMLTAEQQGNVARTDIGSNFFSVDSIAELLDISSKQISKKKLGQYEYFVAETAESVTSHGYKFTMYSVNFITVNKGWMYWYRFGADSNHSLYQSFEDMVASAVYGESTSTIAANATVYYQAIDAYKNGDYEEAKRLFHCVPEFGDSEDYLRLIRIRGYGENVGMGSAYNHNKRLTDAEKEDIDKAAENFDFADTAEVLLCKTDVACYYLMGKWTSQADSQHSAYFIMEKHSNGGYQYRRNMDNYKSDSFSINNGVIRVSITSSNTEAFHLVLLGPDELYVYNCKDEEVYILYR